MVFSLKKMDRVDFTENDFYFRADLPESYFRPPELQINQVFHSSEDDQNRRSGGQKAERWVAKRAILAIKKKISAMYPFGT